MSSRFKKSLYMGLPLGLLMLLVAGIFSWGYYSSDFATKSVSILIIFPIWLVSKLGELVGVTGENGIQVFIIIGLGIIAHFFWWCSVSYYILGKKITDEAKDT